MRPTGDESGEMGDVEHQQCADLVGDRPEGLGVEPARIARGAGNDQLRAVLERLRTNLVEVDPLLGTDAVGDEVVEQPAGIDR